jgi:hypothetical protein
METTSEEESSMVVLLLFYRIDMNEVWPTKSSQVLRY